MKVFTDRQEMKKVGFKPAAARYIKRSWNRADRRDNRRLERASMLEMDEIADAPKHHFSGNVNMEVR